MTGPIDSIRERLRELERAFTAFDKGQRNRLYESRDSMLELAQAVEASEWSQLGPLCDIANRLLGVLIMECGLDEQRSVGLVRELLAFVEAQVTADAAAMEGATPGGVFHVVNSKHIGEILLQKGLIAPDQLEKALLLQRVSKGRRVGQVLVAMNVIDQRTLDAVLDNQRAETRREETRRSSMQPHGSSQYPGQPVLRLTPLPPPPPSLGLGDGTHGPAV